MKKENLKYYLWISAMLLVGSLHSIWFSNNDKYDVYLWYGHERYLTNILYDISCLFDFSVLAWILKDYNKKVFLPLFYLSLLAWIYYFLWYNQWNDIIIVPSYLAILWIFKKLRK